MVLFDVPDAYDKYTIKRLFSNSSSIIGDFENRIFPNNFKFLILIISIPIKYPKSFLYIGILNIEFKKEYISLENLPTATNDKKLRDEDSYQRICLVNFASYSAARKTLETLIDEKRYEVRLNVGKFII